MATLVNQVTARDSAKDIFAADTKDGLVLRAMVLVFTDQLNTLRALHSLRALTGTEVMGLIETEIDSGNADRR